MAVKDFVLLKTCNRMEVFCGDKSTSYATVRHLFRLASGLESKFIGETAIQGQIRRAYNEASKNFKLSRGLHRLFQNALRVGKKVRAKTNISKGALSYSQAVYKILKDQIDITQAKIIIIGINNLSQSIIKYITKSSKQTVFLSNRTYEKAKDISEKLGCKTFFLSELKNQLLDADVLISITSAPHIIVKSEDFPRKRKMIVIDLASPPDVDVEITMLPFVKYYGIAFVEDYVLKNHSIRSECVEEANMIVDEEVEKYFNG